jgi:hypothetical protein
MSMRRNDRSGDLTVDALTALAIATVLVGLVIQARILPWKTFASAEKQQRALLAADNALELISGTPWSELDTDHLQSLLDGQASLWGVSTIRVQVADEPGPPEAKRIEVMVPIGSGSSPAPVVRLSLWRFAP